MDQEGPHDTITICMLENGDVMETDFEAYMSLNLALVIFLLVETIVTLEIRSLSQTSKNILKSIFEFKISYLNSRVFQ